MYQMGNTTPLLRRVQGKLESAAEEVSQAIIEEIQVRTSCTSSTKCTDGFDGLKDHFPWCMTLEMNQNSLTIVTCSPDQ